MKELDLLKEFFAARIETLKMSITDLLNEKEDFAAVHESDRTIKEHLIERVNQLDKLYLEKSTEMNK